VQHIGLGNEEFDERKVEAAMTSVEHLRAFAKPLGVRLLLENIPNELTTPERLVEFINSAHFEDVGVCFDLGHAHMLGGVAAAFEILKAHIQSTHVHDNRGDKDAHLWPGDGSIDWPQAVGLLRSAPHVPPLLLEVESDPQADTVRRMAEVFRKLEESEEKAAVE
jgi:sugar phosphate isomerase/epimerase